MLHQVSEACFAHPPDRLNAPCNPNMDTRLELFTGLIAARGNHLRNRVRRLEPVPVGPESQSFDLPDTLEALLNQVWLKRQ
jgi:hypothetical protein